MDSGDYSCLTKGDFKRLAGMARDYFETFVPEMCGILPFNWSLPVHKVTSTKHCEIPGIVFFVDLTAASGDDSLSHGRGVSYR